MNGAEVFNLLRFAGSPEEALEALGAAGVEAGLDEVRAKWVRARGEALSVDELEAVNGGAILVPSGGTDGTVDRDWAKNGCAATVESGSWCWSNDYCNMWNITYKNCP